MAQGQRRDGPKIFKTPRQDRGVLKVPCREGGLIPYFPEEEIDRVRRAADIVRVIGDLLPLKRAGRHFKTLCPFHPEKTPSFMVNPERQIFHCFGCGEGGNVISFLMKYESLEFPKALEELAGRFGIVLKKSLSNDPHYQKAKSEKELCLKINRIAARHFFENLHHEEKGKKARAYLEGRKISLKNAREAVLGYAGPDGHHLTDHLKAKGVPMEAAEKLGLIREKNGTRYDFFRDRLIFAIVSAQGEILGFSARSLDSGNDPKYINSPDSLIYNKSESLLGFHLAKQAIRQKDQVIIVEGNFDQLRLYQEGIDNAVAPLGTALTQKQVSLLRRFTTNLIIIFDGDAAGQRAAMRALEVCLPLGVMPRAVTLPASEDPDSFVMKEGPQPLLARIEKAPLLLDTLLEKIVEEEGDSVAGKRTSVERLSQILALLSGDVEKSLYIQKVAHLIGLPEKIIAEAILKKGKKGSNLLADFHEDGHRVPVIERTLVQILISGRISPEDLFIEIKGSDFSDPVFGGVWKELRADFERYGTIDIGRIVSRDLPEGLRKMATELAIGATEWVEKEEIFARNCVKKFRIERYRGILKGISREIREAEQTDNLVKVEELLKQKNVILKDINTLH